MTDPAHEAAEELRQLLASAQTALGDPEPFTFAGKQLAPAQVVAALEPYLTEARRARIDAVLADARPGDDGHFILQVHSPTVW